MKICAVSPLESANAKDILDFIGDCEHDLVVLPGYAENHPSYQSVATVLKPGVFAFVETGPGNDDKRVPWLVSSKQQVSMPSQIFSKDPKARDLDDLQEIWDERTHNICGRMVLFAICGEINAFRINGLVRRGDNPPYDVLVNPAHTIMGFFAYLGPKLTNLSEGRVVVHVANNNRGHHRITTDVRIYVNGEIMDRKSDGSFAWSECEI